MSGEAVVVPVVPVIAVAAAPVVVAGAGIALTVAVAGVAARAVQRHVEARQAAARKRLEQEQAQIAAWQAQYQHWLTEAEAQRREGDALRALQHQLLASGLREPVARPTATESGPGTPAMRSELYRQRLDTEQTRAVLETIRAFLAQLPASMSAAPRFTAFQHDVDLQLQRLTTTAAVSLDSATTLQAAVHRTAAVHLEREERHRAEYERLLQRAHELIQATFALESLDPRRAAKLRALREELTRAGAEKTLTPDGIERGQRQLLTLRTQIERAVALDALRPALAESLCGHLRQRGYQVVADFPSTWNDDRAEALLRIPGGERVRIGMNADGRLQFGVQHERTEGGNAPLTRQEKLFLRQQEQRWCADLKDVVRALVEDGFPCQIEVERPALFAAIPIVNWVPFRAEDEQSHQVASPAPNAYDWQADWERQNQESPLEKKVEP